MGPRRTKEQIELCVNELLRVMLDGAQRWDYLEYVREREADPTSPWYLQDAPPLTYSQIRRYIGKAKRLILETGAPTERGELLKMHVAKRDHLYAKAVSQGDTRSALAILDSQAKLQKLVSTDEGRAAPNGHTTINIFERVAILAEQLRAGQPARIVDSTVSAGDLLDDHRGEPVDQAHADPEAERVLACG